MDSRILTRRALRVFAVTNLLAYALLGQAQRLPAVGEGWPTYGGDPGGTRFSQSAQITRQNLGQLHPVWTFHTRALGSYPESYGEPSFETTPVLSGDTLFLSSPYDVVFALDARTGAERWHFDPRLGKLSNIGAKVTSRGVALWPLAAVPQPGLPPCSRRIFIGTLDARLLALDAATGLLCAGFGESGSIDLLQGVYDTKLGTYSISSPPTVVGNTVVVGSAVLDSQQVDIESGLVRGYDAVTGKLLWSWEPLPWAAQQKVRTGAGNTWSIISADPALGLVYLPTGSASLDYYGATRPGDDRDANSVVALNAATGKKVWAFQVVHHDLWDYDIASEPVLFTWRGKTPAIAVTTKMGLIFLLDRRTGQPLVPVEERPVPQTDVPGEQTSPTQPFQNIPPLAPLTMSFTDTASYQRSSADAEICREELSSLRYDGMYTPPSVRGSLHFPGPIGGVHWGGAAIDPSTGILYADTNRIAFAVRLVPRYGIENSERHLRQFLVELSKRRKLCLAVVLLIALVSCIRRRSFRPGWASLILLLGCAALLLWRYVDETQAKRSHGDDTRPTLFRVNYPVYPQRGSPYMVETQEPVDSHHVPCTPAPWGGITAVNLNTLTKVWEKPLGSAVPGGHTGSINFGGPIVTISGLVIATGTQDAWLRVFDAASGEELRRLPLPVPAVSTPMTYTLDGRQYIVVAAGGHGDGFSALGDSIIAFGVN